MVMAAQLSLRLGLVEAGFVARLTRLIERAHLPVVGPQLPPGGHGTAAPGLSNAGRYLELMRMDKKAYGGEIRFVVIDKPGVARVRSAPDALVRDVIDSVCR